MNQDPSPASKNSINRFVPVSHPVRRHRDENPCTDGQLSSRIVWLRYTRIALTCEVHKSQLPGFEFRSYLKSEIWSEINNDVQCSPGTRYG